MNDLRRSLSVTERYDGDGGGLQRLAGDQQDPNPPAISVVFVAGLANSGRQPS